MKKNQGISLKYVLLICFFLSAPASHAAGAFTIADKMDGIPLGVHMEYLEDRDRNAPIGDIAARRESWTVSRSKSIGLGYTMSAWWFRFTLANTDAREKEMLLEVDYPRFERIDLYVPDGTGGFTSHTGGTDFHFSKRKFIDRNFVYRIALPPGLSTCYLRIKSGNPVNYTLKAWTLQEFIEARSWELPVLWIYYGLMLIMMLYCMCIFLVIREWAYIYCSFFILCYNIMMLSINGLGFQYLWPGRNWWEIHNAYFFLCICVFWLFVFLRTFLDIRNNNPLFDRIMIYTILGPSLPLAGLSVFLSGQGMIIFRQGAQVWSLYYCITTLGLIIYQSIKGYRQALFCLFGFITLILGGIIFILKNFAILPVNFFTLWSWQMGSALMIILLALGLFDKFNTMRLALQKSEEELLDKNKSLIAVNQEMEATNEELAASNEEFEAMNEELVRSQEQIIQSEKKFRTMLERFPMPILVSRERDIEYLNDSFKKTFGFDMKDAPVMVRVIQRLFPVEEERNAFIDEYRLKTEKMHPGEVIDFDTKKIYGDGGILEIEIKLTLVDSMTIIIFNNITERKQMEKERDRLVSLIEATSDFISMADTAENIIFINAPGRKMVGIDSMEDVKTKKIRDMVPDWAYNKMVSEGMPVASESGIWLGETALLTQQGREIPVSQVIMSHRSGQGPVEFYSTIMRDISERRHTQDLMVLTEKMTTVGGLAAGMAHEINNPLGVILQAAQMATLRLEAGTGSDILEAEALGIDPSAIRKYAAGRGIFSYLQAIREAGERAATIVSNMLQFSRRGDLKTTVEDIHELIEKALNIAMNDYSLKKKYDLRKITLVRNYDRSLPGVFCCGTEIEQVILNLLKNAAQAMGEMTDENFSPVIGVRTYRENENAMIEISDNGPGIPAEVQKRIFEPFFTTKKTGDGTGLGLSVSYYIITSNHKGSISVRSKEGAGTEFTVKLPLSKD